MMYAFHSTLGCIAQTKLSRSREVNFQGDDVMPENRLTHSDVPSVKKVFHNLYNIYIVNICWIAVVVTQVTFRNYKLQWTKF